MSGYEFLTANIQVPADWPTEFVKMTVLSLLKLAIEVHQSGQKVVVTIENVSAMITSTGARYEYRFVKTNEIHDEETFKLDIITPAKMVIVTPESRVNSNLGDNSRDVMALSITSNHPIFTLICSASDNHAIKIVAPNLKKYLTNKGIEGPDMFNITFQTEYRINNLQRIKGLVLREGSRHSISADNFIIVKKVDDNGYNLVHYERIPYTN